MPNKIDEFFNDKQINFWIYAHPIDDMVTFINIYNFYSRFIETISQYYKPKMKLLKISVFNEIETKDEPSFIEKFIKVHSDAETTFLDINKRYIKKFKKKYPTIPAVCGDIRNLPFKDKQFDMIIDFSVIDHTTNMPTVISEYNRILNSNGFLFLVAWCSLHPKINKFEDKDKGTDTQVYFLQKELEENLEKYFNCFNRGKLTYIDLRQIIKDITQTPKREGTYIFFDFLSYYFLQKHTEK